VAGEQVPPGIYISRTITRKAGISADFFQDMIHVLGIEVSLFRVEGDKGFLYEFKNFRIRLPGIRIRFLVNIIEKLGFRGKGP